MIKKLTVQDVALIQDAVLYFSHGLTVITGETGSGKTSLLKAIELLVGMRADSGFIREGTQGFGVSGSFEKGDETFTVRRTLTSRGRSWVELNGKVISLRKLKKYVGKKVDLCGQHEHQRLLSVSTHAGMLDSWAGEEVVALRESYDRAFAEFQQAQERLLHAEEHAASLATEVGDAQILIEQIDAVSPEPDELDELSAAIEKMDNAEQLIQATNAVYEVLTGDGGAIDLLMPALAQLESACAHDSKLSPFLSALNSIVCEGTELAEDVRRYRDDVEFDQRTYARMQERLAALRGLVRRYGPEMSDVLYKRSHANDLICEVDAANKEKEDARELFENARINLTRAGNALHEIRLAAAPHLACAITERMESLQMKGSRVSFDISPVPREEWGPSGPSRVELMYTPAEGMRPRSFEKIASGGEVSRIMLACKAVAGEADHVDTLVFDEVDIGVGGKTARTLAHGLAELACTHQVIVVTHLPQIAAVANAHYVVEKKDGVSVYREVSGEARVCEIARMLAGDTSKTAIKHAEELLDESISEVDAIQHKVEEVRKRAKEQKKNLFTVLPDGEEPAAS